MKIDRKTIKDDEEYLRQISAPVDFKDNTWQEAVKALDYFCNNEENCMAMASVQLGFPLRIVYLKKTDLNRLEENYNEAKVLINPTIKKSIGKTKYWEACISCLDNTGLVERPYEIELEYYDTNKQKHIETFTGFSATVLSHELDHLDGILHIDIALEVLQMNVEERKEYRKTHPYEIISKNGIYQKPTIKKIIINKNSYK